MFRSDRDNQRNKVYKWENHMFPGLYTPSLTKKEVVQLAHILSDGTVEVTFRKTKTAFADGWRVNLPSWAHNPVILAHEIAHTKVHYSYADHGPEFMEVYGKYLCAMGLITPTRFMTTTVDMGVDYGHIPKEYDIHYSKLRNRLKGNEHLIKLHY
jgi:hypothetical protein